MATAAGAVAAAAVARARRELAEYFEQRGAYDPAHAVEVEPASHIHERQLELLVGRGIVKQTMEGLYWFDREAFGADEERRSEAAKRMLVIVAIVLALVAAGTAVVAAFKG